MTSFRNPTYIPIRRFYLISPLLLVLLTLLHHPLPVNAYQVPDCGGLNVSSLLQANEELNLLFKDLVYDSVFFRLFKVDLSKECPFWPDDGMCLQRDCSVGSCEDDEIPAHWKNSDPQKRPTYTSNQECVKEERGRDVLNDVDRSLKHIEKSISTDSPISNSEEKFKFKSSDEGVWTVQDHPEDMTYVDLTQNLERYTGYKGTSAMRAWKAIYEENCFNFAQGCKGGMCLENSCKEERVMYRLISGIHTSISMHIVKEFLHKTTWGYNLNMYKYRVGNFPERKENLYFTLALVIRALAKASSDLNPSNFDYKTGWSEESDKRTEDLIEKLFQFPLLQPTCEGSFDETDMFLLQSTGGKNINDFRAAFRNISSIMDCVGCEKCKLWGKLQFLGLGTALKILFEEYGSQHLQRNEVIALMNLVAKLSSSTKWIQEFDQLIESQKFWKKMIMSVGLSFTSFVVLYLVIRILTKEEAKEIENDKEPLKAVAETTNEKKNS